MLNHTYDHEILKGKNIDEKIYNIKSTQEWFEKYGFIKDLNILIYPCGEYDNTTIDVMKNLNIISGRSTIEGYNDFIIDDLYSVKVKNVYSNIKPKEVYKWIDFTIENKKTLILLFHQLEKVTNSSLMQYNINDFYKIIDYIYLKRKELNIITYSDWVRINNYINNLEVYKKNTRF